LKFTEFIFDAFNLQQALNWVAFSRFFNCYAKLDLVMPIDKDHISTLMKLREGLFRARENLEEQINDDFYSG
jgi:hypothetical protein